MASPRKLNTRVLTRHLTELGQLAHTVDDNGRPISREEALADLLWNKALGYVEQVRDDEGNQKSVVHKPEAWAIQYIYDRREGRAVISVAEDEGRVKAAEKVRDLAKARINSLAVSAAGPAPKGPPAYKPKGK